MKKTPRNGSLVGEVIGDHEILSLIAEGGFGKTYKAKDLICGGIDCIKDCSNVPEEFASVLVDEFNAIRDLRHFGLPSMRRLMKTEDGKYAIVMSYIPGLTLEQIVERSGPLVAEHVAWITERILNILKYMHFHGVIHGDIKPQNIIIQPKEHTVVLIDFGLAMVKPKSGDRSKGWTEEYAPPEEMEEEGKPLLPESDLYSLGKVMIYALSGGVDLVKKLKVPDSTPEGLCDLIRRLIVYDVNGRPHWGKEDLCETIRKVRLKDFKRSFSNMMPLPAIVDKE